MTCPSCHTPLKPFKIQGTYVRGSWLVCDCGHEEGEEIVRNDSRKPKSEEYENLRTSAFANSYG